MIKGAAVNNDGSARVSFTAPSVDGQAEAIAMAQAVAGIDPETISYVEAHGTGTALGDPIEIAGLTQAFRIGTDKKGFCAIGSVKTNIGHLDAAAGVAGLIKTALSLHHKTLPPSLHFESPNPKLELAETPFFVNARLRPWPDGPTPRRAGVSSFGVGGTNAHVVLEEAPARSVRSGGTARAAPGAVGPDAGGARRGHRDRLRRHLEEHPGHAAGRRGVHAPGGTAAIRAPPGDRRVGSRRGDRPPGEQDAKRVAVRVPRDAGRPGCVPLSRARARST